MPFHPHIFVPQGPDPVRFTSPSSGPRDRFEFPQRNRGAHANSLVQQLEAAQQVNAERVAEQREQGLASGLGVYLTFESEPNFELKFESLDVSRSGIELCTVKTTEDARTLATVFVPDGKLVQFIRKVEAYRDENTTPRREGGASRPKNEDLVASIASVHLAALEALWTEPELAFPPADAFVTWEVWLRRDRDDVDHLARLRVYAAAFDLIVGQQFVSFIDRQIVLVRGTGENLARSADILGMIAELRIPKATAAFFTAMNGMEQEQWAQNLAGRLVPPDAVAPYVCLLDTGLNHQHPLIAPAAAGGDMHTYKPAWGADDREGHGTPMGGLALYGDLADVLEAGGLVPLTHRLESVKIVNEADPNDPELYAAVTQESVYRVELTPDRNRVYCMAITATDGRDRGKPTSWSAAVDALASASDEEQGPHRLLVVSAGNTDPAQRHLYPDSNLTDSIHDPAQAWNALTVGGYTAKAAIDAGRFPGWTPLAPAGDLSPSSCTSTTWAKTPIKPDIVMEAGNMGINPDIDEPDYIDDRLQLLSTGHNFLLGNPFTSFGDTSAAAALASRYAAMFWAKYPGLRPETVRAMMIHSAEWTPEMIARFRQPNGSLDYRNLVRCFGRGVPNLRRLLSSLDNSLTLVLESELQPFFKDEDEDSPRVKTREMREHPLPWPTESLDALGDTPVAMKVTLSYFVEPSPGSRGWTARYGYQSHGLRFAVRHHLESEAAFRLRVNRFGREEDYEGVGLADPGWDFGYSNRGLTTAGSIHSDVWRGTAAELASRGFVAIYPTMGWWNKRPHLNGWEKSARYSLIVTIETPTVETELYTEVAEQIGVPIVIEN
jgi:hypothetical protein